MANDEIVNEFDKLFAEIILGTPETAVVEVADPGDEPSVVSPPILRMETLANEVKHVPAQVVEAKPAPKPRYQEVDGKVNVEGGPCETVAYPKGYMQFRFGQTWNKCALYLEDIRALRDWFRDEGAYDQWEADAIVAGLKARK